MSDYRELYKQYKPDLEIEWEEESEWSKPFPCFLHQHGGDRSGNHAGISKKTGIYNCFTGCGIVSPANAIVDLTGCSLDEAYQAVDLFRFTEQIQAEEIPKYVPNTPIKNEHFEELYRLSIKNLKPDMFEIREYMYARKIKFETLQKLSIGWLPAKETTWNRDSLVFPYVMNGRIIGLKYRDAGGNKSYETGTALRFWNVDLLDLNTINPVVVLAEGESDTACIYQATNYKYPVLGIPGSETLRKEWSRDLKSVKQIICVIQDDAAGLKLASNIKKFFPNVIFINLPWAKGQDGNDIADWLRYNSEEKLESIIEGKIDLRPKGFIDGFEFFEAANRPEEWIIENLLSKKNILAIGGQPKAKKTICAINMLKTLIDGENFLGIPEYKPVIPEGGYKILFIEEEGSDVELCNRVISVFGDGRWRPHTFWGYQQGVKLDEDTWSEYIIDYVKEKKIDLIFLDPFARMHIKDENDAAQMALVWSNIARISRECEGVSFVIIHHFSKSSIIEDGIMGFRGSGSFPANLDTGVILENMPGTGNRGLRCKPNGRKKDPTFPHGKDYFTLKLEDSLIMSLVDESDLLLEANNGQAKDINGLEEYISTQTSCDIQQLAKVYGTSPQSLLDIFYKNKDKYILGGRSNGTPTNVRSNPNFKSKKDK